MIYRLNPRGTLTSQTYRPHIFRSFKALTVYFFGINEHSKGGTLGTRVGTLNRSISGNA